MKKIILLTLLFCLCFFTKNLSAQGRGAGGASDGLCVPQPNPVSFKRNNGQGTCGSDGQIRLSFDQMPATLPQLVGLMYLDGTPITTEYLPVEGELTSKGYASYCLTGINVTAPGNSQGNIAPAKKIIAIFHYPGGCQEDTILYQ